ncbi:uncharacterized protein LOC119104263 isoform X2 [Pollicipes pollicipes]|uniref:uncharacterized protein LOC119104263 isoform X2 n=1 Tax=Pollicipes pollicipes TaxID=41117 RepID=UPI001885942C|nr:uncharacterized protein LOC119104263 isoform X2 [Pollicipes pollicipes]
MEAELSSRRRSIHSRPALGLTSREPDRQPTTAAPHWLAGVPAQQAMPAAGDQPQITYVRLQQDRLEEVVDFMVDHFFTREPTFSVLAGLAGGAPGGHRGWLRASIPEWNWDASWVALDAARGATVGASLSAIYGPGEPDPYSRLWGGGTAAGTAYQRFLMQVDGSFNVFRDLGASAVSENLMLAVDPRYCGLGVGSELCRRTSLEGAVRSGAPVSLCFCTSSTTQHIYERLGFEIEVHSHRQLKNEDHQHNQDYLSYSGDPGVDRVVTSPPERGLKDTK